MKVTRLSPKIRAPLVDVSSLPINSVPLVASGVVVHLAYPDDVRKRTEEEGQKKRDKRGTKSQKRHTEEEGQKRDKGRRGTNSRGPQEAPSRI